MEGGESAFETAVSDGAGTLDDLDEDVDMVDAETLEGDERNAVSSTDGGDRSGGVDDRTAKKSRSLSRSQRRRLSRKNRRKDGQGPSITDINRFVIDTCRRLKEKKSYLVWNAVGCLGVDAVHDLVKELLEELHCVRVVASRSDKIIWKPNAVEGFIVKGGYAWVRRERLVAPLLARKYKEVYTIQDCGGQMTSDGKRFRTGGGILWNILKMREPKAYKEIMAKGREFEKQLRQPNKKQKTMVNNTATLTNMGGTPDEKQTPNITDHALQEQRKLPSPEPNRDRVSVLNRIRVPVAYDDLFEEGEIGS
ncbi:hypothetical protein QJS04_geneDACA002521 [Acorus gramineus]|uniref:Phosphorylated adapter RNA export protein n=1 Tax=Acorus gramineus TaxID=55184 RepID=A0AAV9ARV9_ACOGR|nr:hypothetical protein QJS04_geneDACA002521 [Acorus gramineus]